MSNQSLPNEVISDSPKDIADEIDRIFELQQQNRFVVGKTNSDDRKKKLKKILNYIMDHRQDIRDAVYKDFKKPAAEVDISEIYVIIAEIKHALRHLSSWMKTDRVPPTRALLGTRSYIKYEPKGVVLIISPWNFPFMLAMGPVISAIAAGNCMIIKPSEISHNTSRFIAQMIADLFDENEVAVIEGGKSVAQKLLAKPFDHVFFTGSTAIGKIIMQEASKNLSTVTLELGGKSPIIIDETADLKDAIEKVSWGKFFNSGQTCVAPDYMFVHKNYYVKALELIRQQITKFYGEETKDHKSSRDYARVINEHHFKRLKELVEEAISDGAKLVAGGIFDESDHFIAPTVLTDVPLYSQIMQEEIFGPILPVYSYEKIEDVIDIINSRPKPLALYIFSRDQQKAQKVIDNTSAGGSCINDVVIQFMHQNLPFGGSNHSGFGKSHGYFGFKEFSHQRAIVKQMRYTPLKWLYPPYTKKVQKLIDIILKYV